MRVQPVIQEGQKSTILAHCEKRAVEIVPTSRMPETVASPGEERREQTEHQQPHLNQPRGGDGVPLKGAVCNGRACQRPRGEGSTQAQHPEKVASMGVVVWCVVCGVYVGGKGVCLSVCLSTLLLHARMHTRALTPSRLPLPSPHSITPSPPLPGCSLTHARTHARTHALTTISINHSSSARP